MARSSSARKVAKVASASSKRKGTGERRPLGFPALILVTLLLGLGLVVWARGQRTTDVNVASSTGETISVEFGVYICDSFVDLGEVNFDSDIVTFAGTTATVDPNALTSGGGRARIQVLYERLGVEVDEGQITLPNGDAFLDGEECGDAGEAVVQLAKFNSSGSSAPDDIFESNLGGLALATDGEMFTLAFVPEDTEIPAPTGVES